MRFLFNFITPFFNWIFNNIWVVLFYSVVGLLIYLNRKKFEIQAKIIALYKTKIGIKFIQRFGEKYRELIKIISYIGIGIGFIGMIYVSFIVVNSFANLFFKPEAPAAFSPVIPGVKVPGSEIFFPFWYTIISIFVVSVVHESAHGLVAIAHKVKVRSTGILFLGPFIGAFVEPDEKKLKKQSDIVQYSIFSAGPFSNILFGILVLVLLGNIINPLMGSMSVTEGFSFYAITPFLPAFNASVPAATVFTHLNGIKINSEKDFLNALENIKPSETVKISNNELNYEFKAIEHPQNPGKALIGITGSQTGQIINIHKSKELVNSDLLSKIIFSALDIISNLLFWMFVLSMGIGIANLLPLGPVDGGRMLQIVLYKLIPDKKKGNNLWIKISLITLFLIILSFIIPLIREVLKSIKIF
ncbi:site-2 protease family protein [Candidatus Woesearchaeota archaeon]|nr:site-2 protease family protein [Candidatus Woesearchaeota archaeon]